MIWKKVKLGEILKRRKETIKIVPDHEYKLVTIRLYHKGVVLRNISKGADIKSTMSEVKAGDFILSGIDARNGAFGIVPAELDGAIVTNDFWCLDPDEKLIGREFLLFLTSTDFFDNICRQSSDGTTQRIRLQKDKFYNYEINLPPLKEQADILKTLKETKVNTELITNELNHQISLVKKIRQQLLQDAVQGKLVPQDKNDEPAGELLKKIKSEKAKDKKYKELPAIKPEEIPFDIPDNWVWCRLDEICDSIVDCPHSTPKYLPEETGFFGIDTTCIDDGNNIVRLRNLSKEGFQERIKRLVPQKGDIVYAREGSIGLAAFIPPDKNICLGQRVMLFRASTGITPEYLINVVTTESYKLRLLEKHRGMGAKHINVKDIVISLVPLPPIGEQHRITAKLEDLMQTCDELEGNIQASKGQNEQLLRQVLREALKGD